MERKNFKNPVMAEYWLGDETKRRETEQRQNKPKQEEAAHGDISILEKESFASSLGEVDEVCFLNIQGTHKTSSRKSQEQAKNVAAVTDETREKSSFYDTYHVTCNPDFTEVGSSPSLLEEVEEVFLSRSSEIQISDVSYYLPKSQETPEAFPRENFNVSRGVSLLLGEKLTNVSERIQGTPMQNFITQVLPKIGVFVPVSKFIFHQLDQPKAFSLTEKFFRMSIADKAVAISPGAPKSCGITEVSLTTTRFEEENFTLLKSPYPLEYKECVNVSLSSSDPLTMTNTLMMGNEKKEFEDIEVLIIRSKREASAPQRLQFVIVLNITIPETSSVSRTTMASSAGPSSSASNIVPPPTPSPSNNLIIEAASSLPKKAEVQYECQFCKCKFNKSDMVDHYRNQICYVTKVCRMATVSNGVLKTCNMVYVDGHNLRRHLMNVHEINDEEVLNKSTYYECEICRRKFLRRQNMYDHLIWHTEKHM